MSLHAIIAKTEKLVSDNSPLILTGIGAAGVLTTAYLTGRATIRAYQIVQDNTPYSDEPGGVRKYYYETHDKKNLVKLTWKVYIPPLSVAAVTMTAIVLANRIGTRRAAALAVAYTAAEQGFQEYRSKVVEQIGKKKEQDIRDQVAQDQVTRAGIHSNMVIIGTGDCIFVDARTMRPFMSTMQDVKKAMNDINYKINGSVYASVNDWYDKIGLPRVPDGDDFGWSNHLLDLDISTTITDDEKPAFLLKFTVEPIRNYDKLHP